MHALIRQIRNARRLKRVSQDDLARLSGVSAKHIWSIENYRKSPTLEVLTKILPPLGLTLTLTDKETRV